jgi:hypothetical protein
MKLSSLKNLSTSARDAARAGAGIPRFLMFAGIFHVMVSLIVFLGGREKILPTLFESNGTARFASDSTVYLSDTVNLESQLKQSGLASWAVAPFALHTKIYSLVLAAFGPFVGFNIMAAEPFNLLCYLAILLFVFKLGSEIGDPRSALVAAIIVGVWPSLLLHTTQILKDGLFIALVLWLAYLGTYLVTRSLNWQHGLRTGLLGSGLVILLWLLRENQGPLILMLVSLFLFFQGLRFIQLRTVMPGNLAAGMLVVMVAVAAPVIGPRLFTVYQNTSPHPALIVDSQGVSRKNDSPGPASTVLPVPAPSRKSPLFTRLREEISFARYLFLIYPGAGSNIDEDVRLENWGDVIRYLPRAAEIGLLAPFPQMWLASGGMVGRWGRLLSGVETVVMYLMMGFVIWRLWQGRERLVIGLLATTAALSVTLLALVIPNIGALYRMRYPFWILLLIVGVESARRIPFERPTRTEQAETT